MANETTTVNLENPANTVNSVNTAVTVPVNRTYKSTLFIMLFQDKKNLLELYNAVSGKHYTDPEVLEINTLENAIYMTVKNDISFLIDGWLSLYEHQSTYNPNLPLRFLLYIAKLYSRMTRNANLYGTKVIRIPPPEFLIFYNGKEELPERTVLKLSDMYEKEDPHAGLELEAVMLNISGKNNRKLKDACRTLKDYAIYTDKVREYAEEMDLADAVERAIRECIAEDVLKDFLEKHRAEAKEMSIFEYDQEKHMRQEREEAWAAGLEEGQEQMLMTLIRKKLAKGKTTGVIAEELEQPEERVRKLIDKIDEEKS
ncbi:hypothetical protein [Mediterraneibacter glycyrrhizinilyticus]|uniref:hypothetical protein n=1 Tax=Mediterraneibacter glycyrrhizinilyticus TaxID=342942 RepID=UPI002ED57739